ncbi:MAG TPA: ABC transporter permease [Lacunisphaera sp.]|jgi:predicted permease
MRWIAKISFYLRSLVSRRKMDAQMAEEMRTHLAMETEAKVAAGLSPEEARYSALREFGNVASAQERTRDEHGWVWLELMFKEIRLAVRSLRRAPGFSLSVITTLALCLGPNTAILSMLYALVLKPLPFHDPDRLVVIQNIAEKSGGAKRVSSVVQYRDFSAHADRFEGFGYFGSANYTIGEEGAPVRISGLRIDTGLFTLLGIKPVLGRAFSPDEEVPGKDHVIVLTHDNWVNRYNADPTVIGREIRMDGEPFTIVGVAARSVESFLTDIDFFMPYAVRPDETGPWQRYAGSVRLLARLKPGVSFEAGRAQLAVLEKEFYDGVARPQMRAFLDAGGYHIAATNAREELAEPVKTPLWLLQGGAALVLLIGCVNVASLLLARANAKRPELAIRHSLGAGRATLLRQMLAESLLLGGFAALIGIGLAVGMLRLMNHYLPLVVRHVPPVNLEMRVVGIVLAVVMAIILTMAFVPFGLLWRAGLRMGDTPTASTGRYGRDMIGALVVLQMAVALVLLIGAGLLIHSFARVMAVDPGFDATHIVQARVVFPLGKYRDPNANVAVQKRIVEAMKTIPGADAVSEILDYGVAEKYRAVPFLSRGDAATGQQAQSQIYLTSTTTDYFATMSIRLLAGRTFRDDDELTKNPVAIVDQAFAQRYFPGRDVVGLEISLGSNPPPPGKPWIRIIGVVARANLAGLEARDGWPFVYLPLNQQPSNGFSLLVRSERPEADITNEMRTRVSAIDPALPLYGGGTLAAALDKMLMNRRALMLLLGIFAGLALMLAGVGLYGVLAYDVSQRTREIGIRGALGASRDQIVALVLRQGMVKAGLGLVLGVGGAIYLTRFLRKMLFDIQPTDPLAFVGVSLLLLVVALLASWLPAQRAAKVDPVIALRSE